MRVLPRRGQNLILGEMLLMVLTVLLMARTSSMVGDDALDAHLEIDNQCGTAFAIVTS